MYNSWYGLCTKMWVWCPMCTHGAPVVCAGTTGVCSAAPTISPCAYTECVHHTFVVNISTTRSASKRCRLHSAASARVFSWAEGHIAGLLHPRAANKQNTAITHCWKAASPSQAVVNDSSGLSVSCAVVSAMVTSTVVFTAAAWLAGHPCTVLSDASLDLAVTVTSSAATSSAVSLACRILSLA